MNITTTYDEAMVKAMIAEAVAREREECAKVCETQWSNVVERMYGKDCAAAIRNRSKT